MNGAVNLNITKLVFPNETKSGNELFLLSFLSPIYTTKTLEAKSVETKKSIKQNTKKSSPWMAFW